MELHLLAEELVGCPPDRQEAGQVELKKDGLSTSFLLQRGHSRFCVLSTTRCEVHFRVVLQEHLRTVRRPAVAGYGKLTLTVSYPLPLLPPRCRKKLASEARLRRFGLRRRTGHDDSPSSQVWYLVDVELGRWGPHLYKDRPACLFPVRECGTHRVESNCWTLRLENVSTSHAFGGSGKVSGEEGAPVRTPRRTGI